jgi:hypothetical protein
MNAAAQMVNNVGIEAAAPAHKANSRLAREFKTIKAMVQIYCRDHHGHDLCNECQGLCRLTIGPLPIRRRKADLRQMPRSLLSTQSPRTGQNRHAIRRSTDAMGTPNPQPASLVRRFPTGSLNPIAPYFTHSRFIERGFPFCLASKRLRLIIVTREQVLMAATSSI